MGEAASAGGDPLPNAISIYRQMAAEESM